MGRRINIKDTITYAIFHILTENKGRDMSVTTVAAESGANPKTVMAVLSRARYISGCPVDNKLKNGQRVYFIDKDFVGNAESLYKLYQQAMAKQVKNRKKQNPNDGLLTRLKKTQAELKVISTELRDITAEIEKELKRKWL